MRALRGVAPSNQKHEFWGILASLHTTLDPLYEWLLKYAYHIDYLVIPYASPFLLLLLTHSAWWAQLTALGNETLSKGTTPRSLRANCWHVARGCYAAAGRRSFRTPNPTSIKARRIMPHSDNVGTGKTTPGGCEPGVKPPKYTPYKFPAVSVTPEKLIGIGDRSAAT